MKRIIGIIAAVALWVGAAYAQQGPTFPGGEGALKEFLAKNTKYPEMAKENGIEGVVTVGFLVMPDGSLRQLKVITLIDPDLEQEAVRVVSIMPAWIPAEKEGQPVEAPAKVDVPFILE